MRVKGRLLLVQVLHERLDAALILEDGFPAVAALVPKLDPDAGVQKR